MSPNWSKKCWVLKCSLQSHCKNRKVFTYVLNPKFLFEEFDVLIKCLNYLYACPFPSCVNVSFIFATSYFAIFCSSPSLPPPRKTTIFSGFFPVRLKKLFNPSIIKSFKSATIPNLETWRRWWATYLETEASHLKQTVLKQPWQFRQ